MLSAPSMFNTPSPASPTASDSNYIQPTLNHGLRVWWAYYWPTALLGIVIGFFLAVFLRILYDEVFISAHTLLWSLRIETFLLPYFISLFSINYVLRRKFRHFRLALLPCSAELPQTQLPVTVKRGLRVWWTFSWRAFIYSLVVTFVATVPLSLIMNILTLMGRVMVVLVPLLENLLINAAVGLFVFYSNVLDEEFTDFRVALLPRESTLEVSAAPPAVPAPNQTGA